MPNSVPILYRFNRATRRIVSSKLQAAAGGSHARWLVSAENLRAVRRASGLLTRAFFDALDANGDERLTAEEIRDGLRRFLRERQTAADWVVISLAKKVSRELAPGGYLTLEEFERRAAEAYLGLELPYYHDNSDRYGDQKGGVGEAA